MRGAQPCSPSIAIGRVDLPIYTDSEKAVARLARQGLSNEEIAGTLGVTTRQVRRCQASIRGKVAELRRLTRRILAGQRFDDINDELLTA